MAHPTIIWCLEIIPVHWDIQGVDIDYHKRHIDVVTLCDCTDNMCVSQHINSSYVIHSRDKCSFLKRCCLLPCMHKNIIIWPEWIDILKNARLCDCCEHTPEEIEELNLKSISRVPPYFYM